MKILMITGSYPPDICGVGDYTSCIMNSEIGSSWSLYRRNKWNLISFIQTVKEVKCYKVDHVFIQYPTEGYGWSLLPHFLTFYFSLFTKIKWTVVLHEYSQLSSKAQLALSIMLMTANNVIFTNEFEKKHASKYFTRLKKKGKVVKIFSNINAVEHINLLSERDIDIINFGHIRPCKGIEIYLDCVQKIRKENSSLKIVLAGQVPVGYEKYFQEVEIRCRELDVKLFINLEIKEVANLLNRSKVAYLPFPDGVSERRGSFLASISNGVLVCTTQGNFTTTKMTEIVSILSPHNDKEKLLKLLELSENEFTEWQSKNKIFLKNEMPSSWNDIAKSYINF